MSKQKVRGGAALCFYARTNSLLTNPLTHFGSSRVINVMYAGWLAENCKRRRWLALRSHFWENASRFSRTASHQSTPTVSSCSAREIAPGTQKDSALSLDSWFLVHTGAAGKQFRPFGVSGEIILKLSQFAGGGWCGGHADGIVPTDDSTRMPSGLIWFLKTHWLLDGKTLIESSDI